MNKPSLICLIALGLASTIYAETAQSRIAAPGEIATAVPETLPAALGGTLLDTSISQVTTPTFSGTLRSAVYDGPGDPRRNLDFYYQFTNDAGSTDAIARLGGGYFGDWAASVFQTGQAFGVFPAGQVAASSATEDSRRIPPASPDMLTSSNDTIVFNMLSAAQTGNLKPGQTSFTFLIRTDAYQWRESPSFSISDGSQVFGRALFPFGDHLPGLPLGPNNPFPGIPVGPDGLPIDPVSVFPPAVPEPGTYALMLAGLGLLGFSRIRRHPG
jgi:hypothetical protein